MTDLSPATQAVADATEILVHHGFSGRDIAAAALRAAAYHVEDDWDEFEIFNYLCGLANELEALPDD